MKKYDFYFLIAVLLLALGWWVFQHFATRQNGAEVMVTQDGETVGCYSLFDDIHQVFIDGHGGRNTLVIKDGKASVSDADCPDKLCVRQKAISRNGESIICLPHRLVIEVAGGEENGMDAIAK